MSRPNQFSCAGVAPVVIVKQYSKPMPTIGIYLDKSKILEWDCEKLWKALSSMQESISAAFKVM